MDSSTCSKESVNLVEGRAGLRVMPTTLWCWAQETTFRPQIPRAARLAYPTMSLWLTCSWIYHMNIAVRYFYREVHSFILFWLLENQLMNPLFNMVRKFSSFYNYTAITVHDIVYPLWLRPVSRFLFKNWGWASCRLYVYIQALVITNRTYAGPFVMNSYDEISQAITDYSMGQNGFERAPGWKSEIGKSSMLHSHWMC